MTSALHAEDWLSLGTPIIDVRSPKEFVHGHIPGAHNLPLFTDEERAVVGTLYKQVGRDTAVLEGLRLVGPKLASIVERARVIAPDGRIRVHCWRGGERSGNVAWLLDKAGFSEVRTLRHGYKGFRAHVLASFAVPREVLVLGGYTGSGKTETLRYLGEMGHAVIDLEQLAHHKGSSFGALGELPQPSTEQFENSLWNALRPIVPDRPVWMEDESAMIGKVKMPETLFTQMRRARLFFVEMPVEERADRLVRDYGAYPKDLLAEATRRIEKRLGPQHCKEALLALERGDLRTVALITLRYYDKAYARSSSQRDKANVVRIPASANDLRGLAERLSDHVEHS